MCSLRDRGPSSSPLLTHLCCSSPLLPLLLLLLLLLHYYYYYYDDDDDDDDHDGYCCCFFFLPPGTAISYPPPPSLRVFFCLVPSAPSGFSPQPGAGTRRSRRPAGAKWPPEGRTAAALLVSCSHKTQLARLGFRLSPLAQDRQGSTQSNHDTITKKWEGGRGGGLLG